MLNALTNKQKKNSQEKQQQQQQNRPIQKIGYGSEKKKSVWLRNTPEHGLSSLAVREMQKKKKKSKQVWYFLLSQIEW